MGLDTNRAAMLGQRAEIKERLAKKKLQAESCCDTITGLVNHNLTEVGEMDIPKAAAEMDQLVALYGDIIAAQLKLDKLNRALGSV
ncbi:MAG: hypothetical protein ABFS18_02105 [Thermodesulfobacteriota bacterium]